MLHRLALRVLPSLTLAVTEEQVRKRKRLVMLAPGLVAFCAFRILKHLAPFSHPLLLLGVSGLLSSSAALWAFRMGREGSFVKIWGEDGFRRISWVVGWIGFAYGVQLSLMVLALLKIFLNYDFLHHSDGPAMMAMIIACTSVARDAFEIGHIRRLQQRGDPIITFPDGAALRALFHEQPGRLLLAFLSAGAVCALFVGVGSLSEIGRTELVQLVVTTVIAGSLTLIAYLEGERRTRDWRTRLVLSGVTELFRFWWWPGLAFAATYYLVLAGAMRYVFQIGSIGVAGQVGMAGLVAGVMTIYGYYLGYRRHQEDRLRESIPAALLRCPFVLGILGKARNPANPAIAQSTEVLVGEAGRRT